MGIRKLTNSSVISKLTEAVIGICSGVDPYGTGGTRPPIFMKGGRPR